jgi:outer membrane protein OmpA-like peptidoglycan-associated protein
VAPESAGSPSNGHTAAAEYEKLRTLLVGPEQSRIEEISDELRSRAVRVEDLADKLPDALALRGSRDDQLGRALSPTIDTALRESIRRDPREMAAAIFPILGPAIRKSIAEAMSGLVRSINRAVEQSLSIQGLKWRIESWRSGVPYPQVVLKHALVYRVEQAFLIHAETGLLLAHVAAPDLDVPEAELVSSMLSAIQDFVKDSFHPAEGATLRTFSVGEHTVQLEAGPRALLALVIKGEPPESLLLKQQDTLETVHLEFASQLASFNGDATPFAGARPLLEDCLETVLTTHTRQRGRYYWLRWAIPLAVVAVAGLALYVRATMRWNRALAAVRAEPGLVVVDADRGWRTWTISGLRDPAARDAKTVLAGIGVTPRSLAGEWDGYMSLDPEIVAARAKRAFDSLKTVVESERIYFDPGSANLTQQGLSRLALASSLVRELDALASQTGRSVRLSLTGRTDPTGADATNAMLAAQRVEVVSEFFEASGVTRSRLIPRPVATSDPLASPDPVNQARINRSVSFGIELPAASSEPGGRQ